MIADIFLAILKANEKIMPKNKEISSVLIIGAGPIIIAKACEFDYSGTQAAEASKEAGLRVVLINSNPATIMTDPDLADATYIEPITSDYVEQIIIKEKPDALLRTVGGQTALNIAAIELSNKGVLQKYKVQMIGGQIEAIEKAENRELLNMNEKVGIDTANGGFVNTINEANRLLNKMSFPCYYSPSFTMGGSGGSIAYNYEEFEDLVEKGIIASPSNEVLIEKV